MDAIENNELTYVICRSTEMSHLLSIIFYPNHTNPNVSYFCLSRYLYYLNKIGDNRSILIFEQYNLYFDSTTDKLE